MFIRCTRFLLTVIFMIFSIALPAQLKSYIPPSPNAMTFMKYGEYPVDHSTGVPQISIPLYNISLKDYSFPITASFHASGRTTSLNFSSLGMNWSLQANGVISREIKGRPDETSNRPGNAASYYNPQSSHHNELLKLESGIDDANNVVTDNDTEYDIYTISFNGISAKFIKNNIGEIVFLTYYPYKLDPEFILTDDLGNKYEFGSDVSGYGFTERISGIPNSWFIRAVTTPSGSRLSFKYGSQQSFPGTAFAGTYNYTDQVTIADAPVSPYLQGTSSYLPGYSAIAGIRFSNSNSGPDYIMGYLTEIEFDNGKMIFEYNPANLLLNSCKVTNSAGTQIIKKIDFTFQSFIPGTGGTLPNNNSTTIKNIIFKDGAGTEMEKYTFSYYPGQPENIVSFSKAKDWWGYANGRVNNPNFIPVTSAVLWTDPAGPYAATIGCTDCKEPYFLAKLAGMLKQIHYPTGGSTELIYESNYYRDNITTLTKEGPGIRIKEIISNDANGNKLIKSYKYGVGESGTGEILWGPSPTDYYTVKKRNYIEWQSTHISPYPGGWQEYRWRVYTSDPIPDLQPAMRVPVYYPEVAEYLTSATTSATNGKTVYKYTLPTCAKPFVNVSDAGIGEGTFNVQNFSLDTWSGPLLSETSVYKYVPAGTPVYQPVSSKLTWYDKLKAVNFPQATIYRLHEFPWEDASLYGNRRPTEQHVITTNTPGHPISGPWKVFYVLDKTITTAVHKPLIEKTINYENSGNTLETIVNYFYDNLTHLNPTRISVKRSDQKDVVTYINYPQDYANGTGFIDDLKQKNILNVPIEKVTVLADGVINNIISGEISTYKANGSGSPDQAFKLASNAPVNLTSFKFSNRAIGILPPAGSAAVFAKDSRYQTLLTYTAYDTKNNPLVITPEANIPVSYIWSYNYFYPVAEIKNVTYSTIEAVLGAANLVAFASNSNPSSTDIKNFLAPLRTDSRLSNAQVTTYSYEPLVGTISEQDIRGQETVYEYDSYKRLTLVRDYQGKILKQYEYSLVNPSYFNVVQSNTFTKTDCGVNYFGSSLVYTVPAGTYSSNISQADADAQAIAELNSKGPLFVNTNGYCWQFQNNSLSQTFVRQCGEGLYGTNVTYTIPVGRYTSLISQADAQAKAVVDANTNGQNYANDPANGGLCLTYEQVFKNVAVSNTFRKSCSFDDYGSTYTLSVPAAKYISTISQADADSKAQVELATGQDYVNANGYCSPLQTMQVSGYTSINYDVIITFTNQYFQSRSYTITPGSGNNISLMVPEGTYTVALSVPSSPSQFNFTYTVNGSSQHARQGSFLNIAVNGSTNITVGN